MSMIAQFEPLNERILLEPIEFDEKRDTILHLPIGTQQTHRYLKVLKVGPGLITQTGERVKNTLVPGDTVLMLASAGTKLRIAMTDYIISAEREIICKVIE